MGYMEILEKLKSKKVVIIGSIILVVLLVIKIFFLQDDFSKQVKYVPPSVETEIARVGCIKHYISAVGTLKPYDSVIIKSEVDAKISNIYFKEGTDVKDGDLLIEFDSVKAKAALQEAEAQYRKAKSQFEPANALANKGVVSKLEKEMKQADLESCAARVDSYKNILEKHKVFAPIEGVVGLREISVGEFISAGKDLIKIVDCYPLKIDFKVPENNIVDVFVGKCVDVRSDVAKGTFSAMIIAIDPECEPATHSFNVRAILEVQNPNLRPGGFVRVSIPIEEGRNSILVPESAVERDDSDDVVMKISDGIAIRIPVITGMRKNGEVEIISGLNDGDEVIVRGMHVIDGHQVTVVNNKKDKKNNNKPDQVTGQK